MPNNPVKGLVDVYLCMLQWKRTTGLLGALLGLSGIMLGAWAAHGLEHLVPPEKVESFKTAVWYQQWHALALVVFALGIPQAHRLIRWSIRLMLLGWLFFSVSIYALVLAPVWGMNLSFLGPITPLGGLSFMMAWGLVAWYFFKARKV
jgi:uncharacterized membrane protein YgdD (TMEM256/DUF423 family)